MPGTNSAHLGGACADAETPRVRLLPYMQKNTNTCLVHVMRCKSSRYFQRTYGMHLQKCT